MIFRAGEQESRLTQHGLENVEFSFIIPTITITSDQQPSYRFTSRFNLFSSLFLTLSEHNLGVIKGSGPDKGKAFTGGGLFTQSQFSLGRLVTPLGNFEPCPSSHANAYHQLSSFNV